jgi:hypothetical protein
MSISAAAIIRNLEAGSILLHFISGHLGKTREDVHHDARESTSLVAGSEGQGGRSTPSRHL